jgi:alpha-glucosidase (family GH31 glycosyl hydrolase)
MQRQNFPVKPVANPSAVVSGENYRFTVLTDGLLRYEWAPDGCFEDHASTFAVNRDLPVPDFRLSDKPDKLEIITPRFHLTYDKKPFSASGLHAVVKGKITEHASVWRYGEEVGPREFEWGNLGGTARTLDDINGRTAVEVGVVSRRGFATIDDSQSMLFDGEGWVTGRRPGERVDGYLFAYALDYRACMKAFFAVSGPQPLLPRWALGNWWSRYYAYRADEYLALMDEFRAKGIPMAVAVLDMDWHLIHDEVVHESGASGWTGYTWDRKLFPDPPAFLEELKRRKLRVTLNDHPAEGVYSYEDPYVEMSKALDHDTSHNDPVPFDITDRKFLDAFFDILHRGLENQGVDFWWIDWQQGRYSRIPGVDPLWMLNHYHFLDSARDNRRPLTFSRYAGPGSHRYPVGFSGDTHVTWDSLHFQPEFTATASNIGYGWWSHDIGGHMLGCKDDELATRWLQFGIFSPIMRLHSTSNPWNTKEPWLFGIEAQVVMTDFLRLRHRLMPYIYTMNARSACDGEPICQPLYWDFPRRQETYRHRNQYFFGSELMIAPITEPRDPKLRLGRVRAWLPPGRHIDIFTGAVYDGDRELWLNRPLGGYPVFAHEGAIIPMDAASEPLNGGDNPIAFEILVVVGADGSFEMVEDDGTGSNPQETHWSRTPIKYTQATGTLTIGPTTGGSGIPTSRDWSVRFVGLTNLLALHTFVAGAETKVTPGAVQNGILLRLGPCPTSSELVVSVGENPQLDVTDAPGHIFALLSDTQIDFGLKEAIWAVLKSEVPNGIQASRLHALDMDTKLLDALLEYLLADSRAAC